MTEGGEAAGGVRSGRAVVIAMLVVAIAGAAALGAVAFTHLANNGAPPHVVATSPRTGAVIAPGPFVLSVTFDRPMAKGVAFTGDPRTLPRCSFPAGRSADGRTFRLSCRAQPHRAFIVGFNSKEFQNFVSADGVPAEPSLLSFSTP